MERSKLGGGVPKAPRASNPLDRRAKPDREWRELEARALPDGVFAYGDGIDDFVVYLENTALAASFSELAPGDNESRYK